MEIAHEMEVGLLMIDIVAQTKDDCLIAIEVDGPSHFTSNKPYRPLGATILKRHLMNSQSEYSAVVSVPFYEWHSGTDKKEMLRSLLQPYL